MKIQCNSCEAAEATVLCCADEAALCWTCDQKVHAANKLARKHQRVPLLSVGGSGGAGSSSSRVPKCDICQEASGFFFCLEDRALLCRSCDVAVHTMNPYVAVHQRFLVTGVQVGLETNEPAGQVGLQTNEPAGHVPNEQSNAAGRAKPLAAKPPTSKSLPKSSPLPFPIENNLVLSNQVARDGGSASNKVPLTGFHVTGSMLDWPLDEFFGFPDFNQNQNFGLTDYGSSKADSGKLGSSEGSPFNRSADEEWDVDECLNQVAVPEIPSPPTFSGLHWQRNQHYPSSENAVFVPDICLSPGLHSYLATSFGSKRRRPSCA